MTQRQMCVLGRASRVVLTRPPLVPLRVKGEDDYWLYRQSGEGSYLTTGRTFAAMRRPVSGPPIFSLPLTHFFCVAGLRLGAIIDQSSQGKVPIYKPRNRVKY